MEITARHHDAGISANGLADLHFRCGGSSWSPVTTASVILSWCGDGNREAAAREEHGGQHFRKHIISDMPHAAQALKSGYTTGEFGTDGLAAKLRSDVAHRRKLGLAHLFAVQNSIAYGLASSLTRRTNTDTARHIALEAAIVARALAAVEITAGALAVQAITVNHLVSIELHKQRHSASVLCCVWHAA